MGSESAAAAAPYDSNPFQSDSANRIFHSGNSQTGNRQIRISQMKFGTVRVEEKEKKKRGSRQRKRTRYLGCGESYDEVNVPVHIWLLLLCVQ